VAQVAELLKICGRREAVADQNGSLDRGLDTQHAGDGEEANKEGLDGVVLPSPFIHCSHLNSPLEYKEYPQRFNFHVKKERTVTLFPGLGP
jgi:hypothetical protein